MTTDNDVARSLGSWLRESRHEDADRVLDVVFEQIAATPQRQPLRRTWRPFLMNNMVRVAVATAAAVILAAVGISVLRPGGGFGGPGPVASPTPTVQPTLQPAPSGPVDIHGLPPVGSTPSDPTPGELVLRYEGSGGASWSSMWVYADGRMVWNRMYYVPADAGAGFIGLVEQRLTPSGVEFLLAEALATGLFDSDIAVANEASGFLQIEVRNGDRLVRATWAPRTNYLVGQTAPPATEEQQAQLQELRALLTDSASWPETAWADRTERAYVPGRFAVSFRGIPDAIEPAQAIGLLPKEAQDLYSAGETAPGGSVLSIEDARALAEILERAMIERRNPESRAFWLRYVLRDQLTTGDQVWISFSPVLPDGEAAWLGPG